MHRLLYTPQRKNEYDDILQTNLDLSKSKGPNYIIGDFNARMICPRNGEEQQIMGQHTMHENDQKISALSIGMLENRKLLVEFAFL